ncbi:oligosaccharide flippase family protein [Flavobacterium laiguense]|uniref:Uncharacterized protein n=1 Tax=Flavobacterium laiguense TaxID=2169409 RepID=A0A2U1JTB0_9FLAO|nr:oligosaccharide flippase family protein [Flavobacterium laiguense]PWA08447.1 hypothetical protein DB891_11495 [Flavobacterium laiguense]
MSKNCKNTSHKTILKATGVFGIMQLMKMLISIVGSKFVAIFLGPIGIGIVGLLNNTLLVIASITSFGFNTTSVREIAIADESDDGSELNKTIFIIQKVAFGVGVFGVIVAVVFCTLLSQWTFGTTNYYHWFVFLSLHFLMTSCTASRVAILQGKRMLKQIAISNIVSSIGITIATVCIYYVYKFDGIIPVILSASAINLGVNLYYTRSFRAVDVSFTLSQIIQRSIPVLKLGLLLSINVVFGHLCTFLIKLYLNNNGATSEILGFYEVSTVILISYVGMVFSAMSIDFYPRLTAIHQQNTSVKELVNNQIEVALLLITPAIALFYLAAPIVIQLLYTKEFLPVILILKAALFSIVIKAIIWPLGFVILANGNKRQYFKQELVGDFLNVSLTILFYNFFGLVGIGFASVLNFSLYGFYVYYIVRKKYQFGFRKDTLNIVISSIFVGLMCCSTVCFVDKCYSESILLLVLVFSVVYSYWQLDKRIGVIESIKKVCDKFLNR